MDFIELSKFKIFKDIKQDDFIFLTSCLKFKDKKYNKGQMLYTEGEILEDLGLIISGCISIEHYDIRGNVNILNVIKKGETFAESYAAQKSTPLSVNIRALEDCHIIFMNIEHLLTSCPSNCTFHNQLIKNLFSIIAEKNLHLSDKILHSSPKTIREKVQIYLSSQEKINRAKSFEIPYNRQQLADYLNVDRSALSKELSKMQKEGVINFRKNRFNIL